MSKRKAPSVTINIRVNTLKAYFGKAPRTEDEPPVQEERHWLEGVRPPPGRLSQTRGGAIQIKCKRHNCSRVMMGTSLFVPHVNPRDEAKYLAAMDDLERAREEEDGAAFAAARDVIDGLKTAWCQPCRDINHKSQNNPTTKTGVCKAEWQRMKREQFSSCGKCGCAHSIEANHRASYAENAKKYKKMLKEQGEEAAEAAYPRAKRKVYDVSNAYFWACNGGVDAMRAESAKCESLCSMCHRLDESSNCANERRGDPEKLKRENYDTDRAFEQAKLTAGYRKDKRDHVNAHKRAVGGCERPDCPKDGPFTKCEEGNEQCFDCDHVDEPKKGHEIADLVHNGMSPATAIPIIDAELPKTRVLCANCHKTRKDWDPRRARS